LKNLQTIKQQIKELALQLGFQQATIANTDTSDFYPDFQQWIKDGYHGDMSYLERNLALRKDPNQLVNGTCRIISLRYNYLPEQANFTKVLGSQNLANISRYALGRDYHKLMRKKLKNLSESIADLCEDFNYRVFVDSAPVLETGFANQSGLGWKGKHTLIINKEAGSWFFLGEIFINIPLDVDDAVKNECGNCSACIKLCPTGAIIAPYKVDATKCISYLTIENQSSIPVSLRKQIGNKIYGCDDCQLACPWNRYSTTTTDDSFFSRNELHNIPLLELWLWDEKTFYKKFEGSPIRRIGYQNWLRNLAVAIGNSEPLETTITLLKNKIDEANIMVTEHINWAINEITHHSQQPNTAIKNNRKLVNSVKKMLPIEQQ